MPNIAPSTWDAIRRHWRLGTLTPEALSLRYDLHPSTVRNNAALHKWPKRGSARHDEALMLRVQVDDLWHDLDIARSRLRAEPPLENPAQARDRVTVLRQWQRAQAALHDMKTRAAAASSPDTPTAATVSNDDKTVILDRLRRLNRTVEPADRA